MKIQSINPNKCEGAYQLQNQILYLQQLANYSVRAGAFNGTNMRREYKMLKSFLRKAGFRATRTWRTNAKRELTMLRMVVTSPGIMVTSYYLFDMLDRVYADSMLKPRWSLSLLVQKLALKLG